MKTKTIRITIGVALCFLLSLWIIESFRYSFLEESYVRKCGVVTFKGNKEQINKHSTSTEFVLVVKYSDEVVSKYVSPATWASHNVGDNVCFSERLADHYDGYAFAKYFTAGLVCFALAVLVLLGITMGITWIVTGEV